MSLETFKMIYDQIGRYLYELHLYNWGEPLLNRRLPEMVEYAKKKYKPEIIISSNLATVSEEWADKIVLSGADLLNVSIDGVTQKSYEKYRVGGRLEQVLKTMGYMARLKKSLGMRKPVIRWQFIPMKHNEHEIESAKKRAKELGVDFRIHRLRLNICDFDENNSVQHVQENIDWRPENPKFIRLKKKRDLENACNFLWDRVVFNWDGSIQPCCKIYMQDHVFEKDPGKGFPDVWNGPYYVKARAIFSGNRAEESFICQRCIDHDGAF
jgi:hypothetical protein